MGIFNTKEERDERRKAWNVKQENAGMFLVDPNPPGRGVLPVEDMFIYVKFTAQERSRGIATLTSGDNTVEQNNPGEINFIATEIKYNAFGEPLRDIRGEAKTYATTNYTNIGGIADSYSAGLLEGFGIKNIDIKYNASLVPQVDVSFTDVRGSALFDIIEQDNRKSPYSIFFKMPYPIFKLTIKGYFGQAVTYCLHMVNWTSKFDPTTGNFDIDANFLGFQQAFLADITMGNILGVNNTEEGAMALSKVPITITDPLTGKESSIPTPSLDEFIKKISKLQVDLEVLKATAPAYQKLKIINTQKVKLKRIQSFIGAPLPKHASNATVSTPYEKLPNSPTKIVTTSIQGGTSLRLNGNYLSIRDYLLFKISSLVSVNEYMLTLYELLEDYVSFYTLNKKNLTVSDEIVSDDVLNADIFSLQQDPKTKEVEYLTGLEVDVASTSITSVIKKLGGSKKPSFSATLTDAIDELKRVRVDGFSLITEGVNGKNNQAPVGDIIVSEFTRPTKSNSSFMSKDVVFVLDFTEMRSSIEKMINEVDVIKEKLDKEATKELNAKLGESLGYNPTIKTVFQILCNNAQALILATYTVAESAEKLSTQRADELKQAGNIDTDIDTSEKGDWSNSTIYAFPKIILENNAGEAKETYIGSESIKGLTPGTFPEIKFIENITAGITEKSAELSAQQRIINNSKKKGVDIDAWVPINPVDSLAIVNPFLHINVIESEGDKAIKQQFYKILLTRYAVARTYSDMLPSELVSYGAWDGMNANITIWSKTIRDVLSVDMADNTANTIIMSASDTSPNNPFGLNANNRILTSGGANAVIDESNGLPKLENIEVSGYRSDDVDYLYIEEKDGEIMKNSVVLPKIIKENDKYIQKFTTPFKNQEFNLYRKWQNNLLLANIAYSIWTAEVKSAITGKLGKETSTLKIPDNDITLIDGGLKPPDEQSTAPPTPTAGIKTWYINLLGDQGNANIPQPLQTSEFVTDSPWYATQSNYVKALLLLNTFPFIPISWEFKLGSAIYRLPKYYLLWVGGTLWRATAGTDPILDWPSSPIPSVTMNEYIHTIGSKDKGKEVFDSYNASGILDQALIDLPLKSRDTIINYFTEWVDGDFNNFESLFIDYCEAEDIVTKYNIGSTIAKKLSTEANFILNAPKILSGGVDNGLSVSNFSLYYDSFVSNFIKSEENKEEITPAELEKKNKQLEPIKLEVYNYFKNIYDKWIAGSKLEDLAYNACGDTKDLFDSFRFIDRGFNDIGDEAVINLDSIATLSDNLNTSLYFFLSKVLRDSNFLFQIMPSYIDYKDPASVSAIFTPATQLEENSNSGPVYLCIYIGATSEVLDINENSRYTYKNDGFDLEQPPPDIADKSEFNLVGFRVSYGAENQSIFKSVSLNQQEHRETGEYFAALTELIDKRGGTQRAYQGTDLYKIFKTRSYTCNIEALGCMNIQPMMYFQLDNVPFFNGAYLILSVNHSITPNHMTTSFSGLRQSKFLTPPVDEITTFLDVGTEETLDGETFKFSNLTNKNRDRFNIGVDPDQYGKFSFPLINSTSLTNMGVYPDDQTGLVAALVFQLQNSGIITNSSVTMIMANMMASSSDANGHPFANMVESWASIHNPSATQRQYYYDDNGYGNPTTQINPINLKEESISVNDRQLNAYKYRGRGYIPIIGKGEYIAASNALGIPQLITDPDGAFVNGTNVSLAVTVSIWKYKNFNGYDKNTGYSSVLKGGKTPYSYSNEGTASNFTETVRILNGDAGKTLEESFSKFAIVLSEFDLLGINPGGTKSSVEGVIGGVEAGITKYAG